MDAGLFRRWFTGRKPMTLQLGTVCQRSIFRNRTKRAQAFGNSSFLGSIVMTAHQRVPGFRSHPTVLDILCKGHGLGWRSLRGRLRERMVKRKR